MMKPRGSIPLFPVFAAIGLLVAVVLGGWWFSGIQSATVSSDWTVRPVQIDFTVKHLLLSNKPGCMYFEGRAELGEPLGFWHLEVLSGKPTQIAPGPAIDTQEDELYLDGQGECYAVRRDRTFDHLRSDGTRHPIGNAPGWTIHSASTEDGVVLVYDDEREVVCLRSGKAYKAAFPLALPLRLYRIHCWRDTLTVCGEHRAYRVSMTCEGDTIRFGEPLEFVLPASHHTAVDPTSGGLAVVDGMGGKLRVIPTEPTHAVEYQIALPTRGNISESALTSSTFYFTLNTSRWGGLDMRPHTDIYAFRFADKTTHRLTAFDAFRVSLLAARGEDAVFALQEGRLHYIHPVK